MLKLSPKELDELTEREIDILLAAHELQQYKESVQQVKENVAGMSLKTAQRIATDGELEAEEAEQRRWQEQAYEKLQPKKPSFLPDYGESIKKQLPDWLTPRAAVAIVQMNKKGYFQKAHVGKLLEFWNDINALARREGEV